MDVQRFDAIARQLCQDSSRRRLLGLFGGTALGGLMAATLGLGAEVEGKKKKKKKSCKKKKCGECRVCQKGKCKAAPDGTACSTGVCLSGVCGCSPEDVCELAETCCTEGIECITDVCFCGELQDVICSCPASDEYCEGGAGAQCCLSGDECSPNGTCSTEECTADNDFCELEFAACAENCGCVSSVGGANLCVDFEGFECPEPGGCMIDDNCDGIEVCVNVGCRCGGGFRGACFSPCSL
jgi:hypothetical protein